MYMCIDFLPLITLIAREFVFYCIWQVASVVDKQSTLLSESFAACLTYKWSLFTVNYLVRV